MQIARADRGASYLRMCAETPRVEHTRSIAAHHTGTHPRVPHFLRSSPFAHHCPTLERYEQKLGVAFLPRAFAFAHVFSVACIWFEHQTLCFPTHPPGGIRRCAWCGRSPPKKKNSARLPPLTACPLICWAGGWAFPFQSSFVRSGFLLEAMC